MINAEDVELDLDTLPRSQLRDAGLGDMPGDVADVLDEWLLEQHGVMSSSHNVGAFLDALAASGYRVERIEVPAIAAVMPASPD